jgi:hypothetical protein
MKERSGMPYDVVAFEGDENARRLSLAEEGMFHRMLRLAWMNGSIPADLTQLSQLIRCRPTTLQKAWPNLSKLWVNDEADPSRLRNKKQEKERIFLELKRDVNREAAKLRWNKQKTKGKRNASEVQTVCLPSQPIPSLPLLTINTSLPVDTDVLAFGEHKHALMTSSEYQRLKQKLNGHSDDFIARFDSWVHEAPHAKHQGVRRQDRNAYASICQWFAREVKEGKLKVAGRMDNGKPSNEEMDRIAKEMFPHKYRKESR